MSPQTVTVPPHPNQGIGSLHWWRQLTVERITFLFLLVLLTSQLLLPPITGLADNGDFPRVTDPAHIFPLIPDTRERFFSYVVPTYVYDPDHRVPTVVPSIEIVRTSALVTVSRIFSKDGQFDLRWMGLMNSVFFLTAVGLSLPLIRLLPTFGRYATCLLLILIFGDWSYLAYFNSFFTDTPVYLFFLFLSVFTLRLLVRHGNDFRNYVGICASASALAFSKAQYFPAILVVVLFLAYMGTWRARLSLWTARVGVCAVLLSGLTLFALTPRFYAAYTYYNVVFGYLLPHSTEPSAVLQRLGLDPTWIRFSGSNAFDATSGLSEPITHDEIVAVYSHPKLLFYQLVRPSIALARISDALEEISPGGPPYGSFAPNTGHAPGSKNLAFSFWTAFHRSFLRGHPIIQWLYVLLPGVILGFLTLAFPRLYPTGSGAAALTITAFTLVCLTITVLLDFADTLRHLLGFLAAVDLQFLLCVIAVIHYVRTRRPLGRASE